MTIQECMVKCKNRVSYVCYRANELIRHGQSNKHNAFVEANAEYKMIIKVCYQILTDTLIKERR